MPTATHTICLTRDYCEKQQNNIKLMEKEANKYTLYYTIIKYSSKGEKSKLYYVRVTSKTKI